MIYTEKRVYLLDDCKESGKNCIKVRTLKEIGTYIQSLSW